MLRLYLSPKLMIIVLLSLSTSSLCLAATAHHHLLFAVFCRLPLPSIFVAASHQHSNQLLPSFLLPPCCWWLSVPPSRTACQPFQLFHNTRYYQPTPPPAIRPPPSTVVIADIIVRGYGGYNTRWALFLLHQIFPLNCTGAPAVTTVFFGANDAVILGRTSEKQHVPIEEYKQNLRKIVHHLKDCSSTMLIILITPPPVDEDGRDEYARFLYGDKARVLPERTNEMTGVYANNCIELAQELNLPCVDLWSLMQKTVGWQKKFLRDGLHLTPEGNEVAHKEVVRVLLDAGHRPQDLPYDFPHHSDIDGKEPHKAFQLRN